MATRRLTSVQAFAARADQVHIWLCPSAFAPHRGGVEELTLKLAQVLARRGREITVVTNRHPRSLPAVKHVEGVQVRRVPFTLPARRPSSIANHLLATGRTRQELERLPRPDLLHVICASSQTAAITRFSQRHAIPLVVTTQGETVMDAQGIYQKNPWLRRDLRRAARTAAVLTACSEWTREQASDVAAEFRRAEVILNGVEPGDWDVDALPDQPVFAAWGRHVREKGFDLLLRAFPLVAERLPGARLLLGGDGPERRHLAGHPGVELLGPLDRAGVRHMLARARVAVVPSRIEPFGIVALEALAAGRGLVYSTRGGLAEAAGGCGRGADPADAAGFAAAMLAEHEAPTPAAAGRRRAKQLSWDRIADEYDGLYQMAVTQIPHGK